MFTVAISNIMVVLLLSPLIPGIIKKVKAFTQKRKGPPVLQLYFDLYKFFSKEIVISRDASFIMRIAPYAVFASSLSAAIFIPMPPFMRSLTFAGDAILFVSLLAFGKFFLTLLGMDTGSPFGAMGSSRENMISSLIEPAFIVSLFTLGLMARTTSISGIASYTNSLMSSSVNPTYVLIFMALIIVFLAESSRIPIDDPSTHLELTMVHEAMVLESSGRHLALLEWGGAIKQFVIISLIASILIPTPEMILVPSLMAAAVGIALFFLKVLAITLIVAMTEIFTVKLKLFSTPNLAAMAFILSFIAFMQHFVLGGL